VNITFRQINDTLLSGIRQQMDIQADSTEQISSGRRFSRPDQDTLGYMVSLDLRRAQANIRASLDAVKTARFRLGASEEALSRMLSLIHRAQALAIQQSSALLSRTERSTAAAEVANLQKQLVSLINTTLEGSALFAGTATSTSAITLDASGNAQYQGNAQDRIVAISPTQTVTTNVRADNAVITRMFASINSFRAALAANDMGGIQNSIGSLNAAGDELAGLTAEVGSKNHSVSIREQVLRDMLSQLDTHLSDHEAADVAAQATRLSLSRNAIQAAYAVVARLNTLSLINFLR